MKKKILLVSGILAGIAAIGFGIKKSKKSKRTVEIPEGAKTDEEDIKDPQETDEKPEIVETPEEKIEKDPWEMLKKEDPLESFQERRALFIMACILVIEKAEKEEEFQDLYEQLIEFFNETYGVVNWPQIRKKVLELPEDEESGKTWLRLYILLNKSRNEYYRACKDGEIDPEDSEREFKLIDKVDDFFKEMIFTCGE
jgi:hypothetical protein